MTENPVCPVVTRLSRPDRPGTTVHGIDLDHSARREDMATERLAALIRDTAAGLGFVAVGFAPVARFNEAAGHLRTSLQLGFQGTMGYLAGETDRADPTSLLPEAQTLIAVALPHEAFPSVSPQGLSSSRGRVARYADGADYHQVIRERLLRLADDLALWVGRPVLARPCVDTAPLLERAAAAQAGLGFLGKSTMLIVPGVGSSVLLGELLVDVEVPSDAPQQVPCARCGRCRRCLEACPTGALTEPYRVDSRRCISYLTIEFRGWIPRALRPPMGSWIFGCDACQSACPFNAGKASRRRGSGLGPRLPPLPPLVELLNLGSGQHRRLVRGTALARVSRPQLSRNAAIALGNSRDINALPSLCSALVRHSSPLVRGHAAWALGRLGGPEAVSQLRISAAADSDARVRQEALWALSDLGLD